MHTVVLDCGNALVKAATVEREIVYPHSMLRLDDSKWERVLSRKANQHEELVSINGSHFAFGGLAERYGITKRQTGAARYTPEYYGVFVAASLARMYRRSVSGIFLYGSHAPGDVDYREDLMLAAWGTWEVDYQDEHYTFEIDEVNTFDEPLGGLMNVVLRDDGLFYQNPAAVEKGVSLVFDIGGHTTDGLIVEKGGRIDYLSATSEQVGILGALEDFKQNFRTNHRDLVKKINKFDEAKVREALRTGMFDLRGLGEHPCHEEADEACNEIVNRVIDIFYDQYGGPANFDHIILTGGGSALLLDRLREGLDHPQVLLAGRPEDLHMANVHGGMKLFRMYRKMEVF